MTFIKMKDSYMGLKAKFGKRLKELRKEKDLNQESFAELLDISPRNLSKIETGQTFPSIQNLEKIIQILNCNPSKLFQFEHFNETALLKNKLIEKIKNLKEDEIKVLYKLFNIIE